MRKLIAAINMTIDGYCNHTAMTPDDEIHQHYNDLLRDAGGLLYGRTTYQLMESYWPAIVKAPTGNGPEDEFAVLIDDIPKIVYSRTLKSVDWKNSTLKNEISKEEILEMKHQSGKDLFAGSPGLIAALTEMNLVDEYQINFIPVILGSGLILFHNISHKVDLKLFKTKTFSNGAVIHYYEIFDN